MKALFVISLIFIVAGCSKDDNNNAQRRAGYNPVNPGYTNGLPNKPYTVGNQTCDPSDLNPNDLQSPANPRSPCNPANYAANGQPNQGVNGPVNQRFNQFPNYGVPPSSTDIPKDNNVGRIVGRTFSLRGGEVQEDGDGSCSGSYSVRRFLYPVVPRQYGGLANALADRMELQFDPQGNLAVAIQSPVGQAFTTQPIIPIPFDPSNPQPLNTYSLDPNTQSITMGDFSLVGPENPLYERYAAGKTLIEKYSEDYETKKSEKLQGLLPYETVSGPSGSSFPQQGGFTLGTGTPQPVPQPPAPQPSTPPIHQNTAGTKYVPFGKMASANNPNVATETISGFKAYIQTESAINPQHVTGLAQGEASEHSVVNFYNSGTARDCTGSGDGTYQGLYFK